MGRERGWVCWAETQPETSGVRQGVLLPGLCGVREHLGLEEGHRL